ncbi:MAG: hypothetical protein U0T82_12165 [Bacteroidales bacterium]
MEKLRIEKIRAAWDEFRSVLQQVEHSGTMSTLDAELLKSKLLATYEALTSPAESKSGITQPVVPDQIQAIKDEDRNWHHSRTNEEKTGKKEVPSGKNIAAKEDSPLLKTQKQEPLKEATHAKIQKYLLKNPPMGTGPER